MRNNNRHSQSTIGTRRTLPNLFRQSISLVHQASQKLRNEDHRQVQISTSKKQITSSSSSRWHQIPTLLAINSTSSRVKEAVVNLCTITSWASNSNKSHRCQSRQFSNYLIIISSSRSWLANLMKNQLTCKLIKVKIEFAMASKR